LLHFENDKVIEEKFLIDNAVYLIRSINGEGGIWAEELNQKIRFQTPPSEIAAFTRRDSIQHKFLEPLYTWAGSLRHYNFVSPLGKNNYVL